MSKDTVCSIDGCHKKVLARGWCQTHYKRWRNYERWRKQSCDVEGCEPGTHTRDSCERAKKELAARKAAWAAKKFAHGTHQRYEREGCRCGPCKKARAEYRRRKKEEREARENALPVTLEHWMSLEPDYFWKYLAELPPVDEGPEARSSRSGDSSHARPEDHA